MTIRFTTSLSLDDFMSANWLILRRYFLWAGLLKLFAFSAVAFGMIMQVISFAFDGLISFAKIPNNLLGGLFFGILMAILIPIVSAVKLRIIGPRRYFSFGNADLPIDWEMDAQGYRASNTEGSANLAWNRLQDFSQDRHSLIFRRAKTVVAIIPKSNLSNDVKNGILEYLKAAGVKER